MSASRSVMVACGGEVPRCGDWEGGSDPRKRVDDLYRRYAPVIRKRCRRMLGADGDDAVHDVFLRVAANVNEAPRTAEAAFWIQRIAINHCLNELRSKRRQPALRAERETEEPAAPGCTADVVAAREVVRRVLLRAPERMRAAGWLHHVHGLTQEEVSEALGLSRRTVINYLAQLRRRAAKALRDQREPSRVH